MYPIISVPNEANETEQLGTKYKFWYRDSSNHPYLFKEGREGTGENWAEKVSSELAKLLKLPHAKYDLATWRGKKGVITPSFVRADSRLILGNEMHPHANNYYSHREHLIYTIMELLNDTQIHKPSICANIELSSAGDIFVGYLMLDTLIGNQDRHDENWGLIKMPEKIELAPTFDHASSLGRNENDVMRIKKLSSKDSMGGIEAYVKRARSALYLGSGDRKPLLTLEAFRYAAQINPIGGKYWLKQLESLDKNNINHILSCIPDELISLPARNFACKMIELNKNRLLELGEII